MLNLSLKAKEKRLVLKTLFSLCFRTGTSALPTALWFWISKMPLKLRKNTMPRRFAPRQHLSISLNVKLGGVFWTKFEHFLSKTPNKEASGQKFLPPNPLPFCPPAWASPPKIFGGTMKLNSFPKFQNASGLILSQCSIKS